MSNCHPCPDCDCIDAVVTPPDHWKGGREDNCEHLGHIIESINHVRHRCNLTAKVESVVAGTSGATITLSVSGTSEPVEVSLNNKLFVPGVVIGGATGEKVVVYVRNALTKTCRTFVLVNLTPSGPGPNPDPGSCTPPAKPVVVVTNNTCAPVAAGSISLSGQPSTLTAYWYPNPTGTGVASLQPPAYKTDQSINGSVKYVRVENPSCASALTTFATNPMACGCAVVGFAGTQLPDASVGVFWSRRIALTGTAPFSLGTMVKPSWMLVVIDNRELVLSGTPLSSNVGSERPVNIQVNNCGNQSASLVTTVSVLAGCSKIEPNWEVLSRHCRTCEPTANWRIAKIKCDNPDNPNPNPCSSTAPVYFVRAMRCVVQTAECQDRTPVWRIAQHRCTKVEDGTPQPPPVNPCAGVEPFFKVIHIHCKTTV